MSERRNSVDVAMAQHRSHAAHLLRRHGRVSVHPKMGWSSGGLGICASNKARALIGSRPFRLRGTRWPDRSVIPPLACALVATLVLPSGRSCRRDIAIGAQPHAGPKRREATRRHRYDQAPVPEALPSLMFIGIIVVGTLEEATPPPLGRALVGPPLPPECVLGFSLLWLRLPGLSSCVSCMSPFRFRQGACRLSQHFHRFLLQVPPDSPR